MGVIAFLIMGLVAGFIARWLMPGAVAALHTAARHADVFDRLLVLSPPLWIGGGRLIHDAGHALRGVRTWIAVGTRESSRRDRNRELAALARRLAVAMRRRDRRIGGGFTAALTVAAGGSHHEDTWAGLLPQALRWLFPR